jgi:hypothetical protein
VTKRLSWAAHVEAMVARVQLSCCSVFIVPG